MRTKVIVLSAITLFVLGLYGTLSSGPKPGQACHVPARWQALGRPVAYVPAPQRGAWGTWYVGGALAGTAPTEDSPITLCAPKGGSGN